MFGSTHLQGFSHFVGDTLLANIYVQLPHNLITLQQIVRKG